TTSTVQLAFDATSAGVARQVPPASRNSALLLLATELSVPLAPPTEIVNVVTADWVPTATVPKFFDAGDAVNIGPPPPGFTTLSMYAAMSASSSADSGYRPAGPNSGR